MPYRPERLAAAIQEEIAEILREMKDPRLGFVSVTGVEVSSDLRHAKIYISVLGSQADEEGSLRALQHAQGFLRTELGRRIRLRYIPEISFRLDRSLQHGAKMAELLRQLNPSTPSGDGNE
jgi:ribosome-binding factor A